MAGAVGASHKNNRRSDVKLENALEQARFEASRAHRQYDAVDPENRLVASNLERRWNERLLHTAADRLEPPLPPVAFPVGPE